jgi:AcrR family transcriptional regulator
LGTDEPADDSSRERILAAAEELFAELGFDATPTSRIAERANVPKGLVHYYFRRKPDLLVALIERLPDEQVDIAAIVAPGNVAASLRALVATLDARIEASQLLSHLLWREADTHEAVRAAMQRRYRSVVGQIRAVITAARGALAPEADTEAAAELLALAVSYRHSTVRHDDGATPIDREINFVAAALANRS